MNPSTPHRDDHASQQDRFPPVLAPDQVKIDGRTLAELIAFAPAFARLLVFRDQINRPPTSWSTFFKQDISVLLAEIATLDTKQSHFLFLSLSRKLLRSQDQEDINQLHETVKHLTEQINEWHDRAVALSAENKVAQKLAEMLKTLVKEQLAPLSAPLTPHDDDPKKESSSRKHRRILGTGPFWESAMSTKLQSILLSTLSADPATQPENDPDEEKLLSYFSALNTSLRSLTEQANQYLLESLQDEPHHPPHTALYLAFVQLFQYQQEHLNTLPARHLTYYYKDILKLPERQAIPDIAHVYFTLAPPVASYLLKAGTHLVAGKDAEGQDILYATQDDLTLTQAAVASLKTLYLPRTAHNDEGRGSRVRRAFAADKADSEDGLGQPLKQPALGWPTFGTAATAPDVVQETYAQMGLVVASPVLLLREGKRRVTLTFTYQERLPETTEADDPTASAKGPVDRYVDSLNAAYEDGTHTFTEKKKVMPPSDVFLLFLSGEKGWVSVPAYRLYIDRDKQQLVLSFVLEATEPAIVENQPKVLGEHFDTRWPLCKVMLNPQARVYPYALLKDLSIRKVGIDVEVEGLRTLYPQNENGLLDASKPFQPFGAVPVQGSYLLFGNKELFQKQLDFLRLTITWFNLPQAPENFETYYKAYGLNTTNQSFQVQLSVRDALAWAPLATGGQSSVPLFQQQADDDPTLLDVSHYRFDLTEHTARLDYQLQEPLVFDNQRPSGFFRLELSDPPYAFGQEHYPHAVANVVAENAAQTAPSFFSRRSKPPKPLPNLPFVPVVGSASVAYKASHELRLASDAARAASDPDADQLFHLYPFGQYTHYAGLFPFAPPFEGEGQLYVGLKNLTPPQSLTLFFQFNERYVPTYCVANEDNEAALQTEVFWHYLSDNQWKAFDTQAVVSDATASFIKSGIVRLDIPDDITDGNSILPAGLHWIMASVQKEAAVFSRTVAVHPQAVCAERVMNGAEAPPDGVLPALTISRLAEPAPVINEVVQPFPSQGYVPQEQQRAYLSRVSERLRHKHRPVQSWDYERLVLDKFPQIGLVKCVTYNRSVDLYDVPICPGDVVVIVVPRRTHPQSYVEPRVDEAVLQEIATYLRQYTSYFVRNLCVRNPAYEYVKIRAQIKFTPGTESGAALLRLQEDLARYIVPWWYSTEEEVNLGRSVLHTDEVFNMMEKQPYVEYVTGFSIEHIYKKGARKDDEACQSMASDEETVTYALADTARSKTVASVDPSCSTTEGAAIRASSPWSVLIPLRKQPLTVLGKKTWAWPKKAGMGNLEIGTDFVVVASEQDVIPPR